MKRILAALCIAVMASTSASPAAAAPEDDCWKWAWNPLYFGLCLLERTVVIRGQTF